MNKVITSTKGNQKVKRPRGNPNLREVSKATQFKPDNKETGEKDPRINRKGWQKPRSQKELESLLDEIFDEDITLKDNTGKKIVMSKLRYALLEMLMDKNSSGRIELLARRYGKIPQPVEGKLDGEIILKVVREEAKKQDAN